MCDFGSMLLWIVIALQVIWIVFGGYYVNQENVPRLLRWLPSASLIKQGFQVRWNQAILKTIHNASELHQSVCTASTSDTRHFPLCLLRACASTSFPALTLTLTPPLGEA